MNLNLFTFSYSLFTILLVLWLSAVSPLQAQSGPATEFPDSSDSKVVRIIRFVGNENVKQNTLDGLIRTKTNREFLGIPRFTPWYFIWKLTNTFGEKPALFNKKQVATDMQRIKRYYTSIGYLEAEVDTSIIEFKKHKMEVSFLIDEGRRTYIKTIAYSGMPDFEQPVKLEDFYLAGKLNEKQINDSTFQADKPYIESNLNEERTRIISFLKNNGYASVQSDSVLVQAKRRPDNQNELDLLFTVDPGKKYTFGDVYIDLAGPGNDIQYEHQDTLSGAPYTKGEESKFYLQKQSSANTNFSLLTDQILFEPGDTFNNELYIRTINKFQNLGMLDITQFGLNENGTQPDFTRDEIPVNFKLQTLPKNSVNFNLFGMRRYGFGSGAGITYTNNNLFGEAENLQLGVNGSFEYVGSETLRDITPDSGDTGFKNNFFRSFETRLDYSLPRLTFPFKFLEDNLLFTNARTRYTLSFNRSDQLLFDINSDIRFNLRYEVNHSERFSSFLDLFELDLLDTDPTDRFRRSLENEFGEGSIEFERVLEDFRPQISSTLRYTFRSQRTDIIKRNFGYFSEYSIAFSGNLPFILDRYFLTPGTVEGSIPSPVKVSDNRLTYSRFIKTTADYRRYIPISNTGVFAYRGFAGVALPYGQSTSIPLNQRFFAGGSNDIRGWDIFSLGPGSVPFEDVIINGGQIKLLAQTEARQRLIEDFISANWIGAWFTDAGNVWYGPKTTLPALRNGDNIDETPSPEALQTIEDGKFFFDEFYKQIAVGSGLGLRLDWDYVIVRFDFAFRIHDLQEGWFNNRKLFFSFGIGHSF